jgi:hypothetical protein
MQPETERRVEKLRKRTDDAKKELAEAKALFGENDDEYLRSQIDRTSLMLDDVETIFLARFAEKRMPPRTLAEESAILSRAEFHLNEIALPLVRIIHKWAKQYGPAFKSIG